MNTRKSHYIIIILLMLFFSRAFGQDSVTTYVSLQQAKLEPFRMQVTYSKTSHVIFPSSIRYVDLGSELLIANKADAVGNVLRIKAAVRDFEEETNFSVITEDGKFYSFDAFYSPYPEVLSYDLVKRQRAMERHYSTDVLFEDLKGSSSTLTELIMQNLYQMRQKTIRHIASKSFGFNFQLGHCTSMTINATLPYRWTTAVMSLTKLSESTLKSSIRKILKGPSFRINI